MEQTSSDAFIDEMIRILADARSNVRRELEDPAFHGYQARGNQLRALRGALDTPEAVEEYCEAVAFHLQNLIACALVAIDGGTRLASVAPVSLVDRQGDALREDLADLFFERLFEAEQVVLEDRTSEILKLVRENLENGETDE